ncbi:MAG: 2-oxo acid dehydrogenase subunit E2 [Armatimonadetes bacterium]|nr:2-oxo acid dehydrogenase subunit E2 [Armatimonadota bacterium]
MTEVIMPKMGDGMEEGTLLEWLKKDGETVKSGEVIGNIQTDKAVLELESPGTGTLTGFLIQPGSTVPVGVPIAIILKKGEEVPKGWGSADYKSAEKEDSTEAAVEEPKEVVAASAPSPAAKSDERVKISPLARRIANDAGIDLSQIKGSGPGGRIVQEDVQKAIKEGGTTASAPAVAKASPPQPPAPIAAKAEDTKVPLNFLRKIIAERTAHSKSTVPHFYVTVEVDVEEIVALRQMFEEQGSGKVSINDFVMKATVEALREMPEANATFQGDHILQFGAIHMGMAVAIDDGLLVAVIKNAHSMTLRQLSAKAKELAGKAREGKLLPDEMSDSTFTISNMGMLNVDTFGAIINEPNAGIVAVSSTRRVPVVTADDELEIRTRMNITGSFDHRVLDGAIGAKFMNVLRGYLENPTRLLQ